jgi:hypothetical protein
MCLERTSNAAEILALHQLQVEVRCPPALENDDLQGIYAVFVSVIAKARKIPCSVPY